MSGAFGGVPNQFANAVTATGLQLDQDFNTFTAYINDPTNRNNYAAAGGATNTLNITFSPPVIGGYTAGLALAWKWNVTSTGAVVLNANTLGNVSLVNPDSSALVGGQGLVGSIGTGVYDGTQVIYLTPPSPASKAQMQTATASASFVSPAQAQNHPGVAKAWVNFSGAVVGTQTVTTNGYGVSNIVRAGTGTYNITFATPFANAAYAWCGSCNGAFFALENSGIPRNTSTIQISTFNSSTQVPGDQASISLMFFGTQ